MRVERFFLFFPPKSELKRGETEYGIGAIRSADSCGSPG